MRLISSAQRRESPSFSSSVPAFEPSVRPDSAGRVTEVGCVRQADGRAGSALRSEHADRPCFNFGADRQWSGKLEARRVTLDSAR
jgi:hypothetical protein